MSAAPETHADHTVTLATHSTFWVSALAVVAFAAWAHFSTLDIVSQASGEVIPSSQVKRK